MKIKFASKQFLNFVPKSYYSVPITLKNAPLWNFLRHQCLKCAHMCTIALTIRHTGDEISFLYKKGSVSNGLESQTPQFENPNQS